MTSELDDRTRRAIATTWAYRARYERFAEARFRKIASDLAERDFGEDVIELATRAALTSATNVLRCDEVARAYGESDALDEAASAWANGSDTDGDWLEDVVAFACVSEPVETALRHAALARTVDEGLEEALESILLTEVLHARVGWTILSHERVAGRGESIASRLPEMLARKLSQDVVRGPGSESDALSAFGELTRATRLGAFRELVDGALFEGFERFGVDTTLARAWLEKTFAD